jgi:hypothetical protein
MNSHASTPDLGHPATRTYRIRRADRASYGCPEVGSIVYPGNDGFGSANEDSRSSGIEHIACSVNESGLPFFTLPRDDCEEIINS